MQYCPSNHNTLNEKKSDRPIVFDNDWGHNVWKTDGV